MRRGDVVLIADGKPRPAVIVQTDSIPTPLTVLLCPLSSTLIEAPVYRPQVEPDDLNGLAKTSQLMTDKVAPIRRDRLGGVVGALSSDDMERLDAALATILGLR